jgi:adenylate cyclase
MITWTEFELFRAKTDALLIASIGTYFLFFILLTNFFIQINKKFGPGVLFDLLTGKYHHPRKENLILLFIDLKGSTTIAEKLGHEKYSEFIKECVHELTPILIKNHAKVYQYVGDEIVLHWKMNEGLEELKCINTFFQFDRRLRELENGFITKYGVAPTFKAGMDMGEVTVTEIGELKREIAFHGDVLNTASRLEQKCNEHSESLLVTESLIENVPGKNGYDFQFVNDITLRGKQEKVKYFAVRHA